MDFIENAEPFVKGLWYITLPATLIFLIQTIMTFVGSDASDGLDADFDGDLSHTSGPLQLFTFRNLIHFLLGFGWTGLGFYELIPNKPLLVLVSCGVGVGLVMLFFFIIKQIRRLNQDNTMRLDNAIGKTAQVYLTIPAQQKSHGKVHISLQNTLRELDAVTSQDFPIPTGASVKIVGTTAAGALLVEKI
ncbi:NfeD family protein [Runella zeae]|uniref:NfeD family protein n=1 Tax=Runella zeae TaxID=94255 RepID=UPI0003FEDDF0|nr:NfeD family protein [Runella zeae]